MTGHPQKGLMKTCSSCGQQKSLAAFLQLSGDTGSSIYGNICSTCRKANKDKPKLSPAEEGAGSSTTGNKIDAKTKIKSDAEKRQFRELQEDLNQQEREDKESLKQTSLDKSQTKAQNETKHREEYLKKGSFLDNIGNKAQASVTQRQFFATEKIKKEADLTQHAHVAQAKHSSSHLLAFKQWVGDKNASIVKNIEKMGVTDNDPSPKNTRRK